MPMVIVGAAAGATISGGIALAAIDEAFLAAETIRIPHGFVRGRGKRTAVFIRSPDYRGQLYNKGTFRQQRASKRGNDLPIAELFARSIPEVILRNGIDATMVKIGEQRFAVEFERQLAYYTGRANG